MGDQQQEYTRDFAMKNGWQERNGGPTWQEHLDQKFPGLKDRSMAGGKPQERNQTTGR